MDVADVADEREQRPAGRLGSLLALARQAPDLAALVVMAVIGIGISIYLTTEHYAKVAPICPATGGINCAKVTSSTFSVVPGTQLPITVPGLLWFIVMGGLAGVALFRLARLRPEPARLRLAQFVVGAGGMAFVLYLVYAEIVQLHAICLWCTGVHILTFFSFLIVLNRLQQSPLEVTPARPRAARRTDTLTDTTADRPSATSARRQHSARPPQLARRTSGQPTSAVRAASGAQHANRRPSAKARSRR